jgi:hypothetical protein
MIPDNEIKTSLMAFNQNHRNLQTIKNPGQAGVLRID